MNKLSLSALFLASLSLGCVSSASADPLVVAAPDSQPVPKPSVKGGKIQIAILLDTSSSMDGLINQARTRMWSIVSELAKGTRGGQKPVIELALYEYGKQSLEARDGYIRRIMPLTRDLDGIAEQLFALTTNGGDEYAGWVIERATKELAWSSDARDVKLMFIAGNEGFDQGSVPFAESIAKARRQGVVINTIYCGGETDTEAKLWRQGAGAGNGSFAMVNQNAAVQEIASPYDAELQQLSSQLNSTYIHYGASGKQKAGRQAAMDEAAATAGAPAARAAAKASVGYNNADWDLVDAGDKVDVAKLEKDQLPEEMQRLSVSDRKQFVEKKAKERKAMQAKIADLAQKREAYVSAERKKQAGAAETMDDSLIKAAKKEATAKGYAF